jgi:hypothetical protein
LRKAIPQANLFSNSARIAGTLVGLAGQLLMRDSCLFPRLL